uniref:Uncharacterized protein n=1 Tax=Cacopsylla melanoneura TaxID=428564 RepID=A0A8D8RKQ4_9HEMI
MVPIIVEVEAPHQPPRLRCWMGSWTWEEILFQITFSRLLSNRLTLTTLNTMAHSRESSNRGMELQRWALFSSVLCLAPFWELWEKRKRPFWISFKLCTRLCSESCS